MADEVKRVDIGFAGGQVLPLRMTMGAHSDLRQALESDRSERWHLVKTQDSEVSVDLAQVVYVRVDTEEHKVGF